MARTIDMEKRREIARKAFLVIKARGVHRTTMADIARALEMKRPALYHYFPNLSAICRAALKGMQDDIRVFVIGRMAEHRHPIDMLGALMDAVHEFHRGSRDDVVTLFQIWAVSSDDAREALTELEREANEPHRVFLIALIENGIERGLVAPCDAEGLVDTVLTLMEGAQVFRVTHDPDTSPMLAFVREQILEPLKLENER